MRKGFDCKNVQLNTFAQVKRPNSCFSSNTLTFSLSDAERMPITYLRIKISFNPIQ